jgi:hypothetical protein
MKYKLALLIFTIIQLEGLLLFLKDKHSVQADESYMSCMGQTNFWT